MFYLLLEIRVGHGPIIIE